MTTVSWKGQHFIAYILMKDYEDKLLYSLEWHLQLRTVDQETC